MQKLIRSGGQYNQIRDHKIQIKRFVKSCAASNDKRFSPLELFRDLDLIASNIYMSNFCMADDLISLYNMIPEDHRGTLRSLYLYYNKVFSIRQNKEFGEWINISKK